MSRYPGVRYSLVNPLTSIMRHACMPGIESLVTLESDLWHLDKRRSIVYGRPGDGLRHLAAGPSLPSSVIRAPHPEAVDLRR